MRTWKSVPAFALIAAGYLVGVPVLAAGLFLAGFATGCWDVAMNVQGAAVEQAPCIFYVQNNQWAISTPLSDQLRAPSIAHLVVLGWSQHMSRNIPSTGPNRRSTSASCSAT